MSTLSDIIRTHHGAILERWTEEAQRAAAARGIERPEFQNMFAAYLSSLADADGTLGRFEGKRRELVESHLASRLRLGFQLAEIVEEFSLVGRCIAATWSPGRGVAPPSHTEIENLFEELHVTSAAVSDMFTRHMMDDEQEEKKILRQIQQVASAALQDDTAALKQRLKDVLAIVMDAMGAQSAAVLLFDPKTEQLEATASMGAGEGELERYASSLDPSSFAGRVAAGDGTTSVMGAAATELRVNDRLRAGGIHSLLGIRLPPRHLLLGVLYVGLAEARAFSVREISRLETLGHHLTIHLDNARLFAALRERVDELDAEREVRERFVAILAHDLRGPLSAAKISAHLILRHPERLDDRRELAVKIVRNIERTDRMIRDLLDANRIRAGERLPLRIDECDLSSVAREVVEELLVSFGERFVLDAPERVFGFWSGEELRRALWNLVTNAAKYGAPDRPITVRVRTTRDGAQATVHNWGSPISADDQKLLFRPFSRTHEADSGPQKGWGLGLTLVKGCAEAHGGRVLVESSVDVGTTFTLELPRDARPFQTAPAGSQGTPSSPPPSAPPPTVH